MDTEKLKKEVLKCEIRGHVFDSLSELIKEWKEDQDLTPSDLTWKTIGAYHLVNRIIDKMNTMEE